MKRGEFKLVRQIGQRGFHGCVWLEAELTPKVAGLVVELAPELESMEFLCPDFSASIRAGLSYAGHRLRKEFVGHMGARVRVTEFRGFVIDTSQEIVRYVSARALYSALGVEDPIPTFDATTCTFAFP